MNETQRLDLINQQCDVALSAVGDLPEQEDQNDIRLVTQIRLALDAIQRISEQGSGI